MWSYYGPEADGVFDIEISGDGTWRKRSYSSIYGIVTALSTVTGKVIAQGVQCGGKRGNSGIPRLVGRPSTYLPGQSP